MPNAEEESEGALFSINEKVLCKYGQRLYEAKVLKLKSNADGSRIYFIHYTYWHKRHDEWTAEANLQKHNVSSPEEVHALRRGNGIEARTTVAAPPTENEPLVELRGIKLKYSKKDIPVPGQIEYLKKLTNAIEKFIRRIGWAVHFVNDPDDAEDKRENYGFKSGSAPPRVALGEIKGFYEDLCEMVGNIKFKDRVNNKFQDGLRKWLRSVNTEKKVLIAADKTDNYYYLPPRSLNKIVKNNVTKDYKVVDEEQVNKVNLDKLKLARKIDGNTDLDPEKDKRSGLARKMEKYSRQEAFVTIKDHSKKFRTEPVDNKPVRLVNPSKTDMGKVSRRKLQVITNVVRERTSLNQWQSTQQALRWFGGLSHKHKLHFFTFDVDTFYPSITLQLLKNAIAWARQFCPISGLDEEVFMHCRRTFLFHDGKAWVKRENPDFDVPIGSYDGAEICEITGLYILNKLISSNIGLTKENTGLYRDDGLVATPMTKQQAERMFKRIHAIFKSENLTVKIEGLTKSVEYLDIKMHLETGDYEPYRKQETLPKYVNKDSNHPPAIIRNLPAMIEKRVSGLCSSQEMFDRHAAFYNRALKDSGYNYEIKYTAQADQTLPKRHRERYPNKYWFNPPYNMAVATRVGEYFLKLIDKHFPKGSELHKYFNRRTVKVSYCCCKNVSSHIAQRNHKVMEEQEDQEERLCKCKEENKPAFGHLTAAEENKRYVCPLPGECLTKEVVYQAIVTSGTEKWNYFGETELTFRKRWAGHKTNIRNERQPGTALSAKVWELKNAGRAYMIKNSIVKKAHPYKTGDSVCDLCLTEKTCIVLGHKAPSDLVVLPQGCGLLNVRDELLGYCPHKLKHKLIGRKAPAKKSS